MDQLTLMAPFSCGPVPNVVKHFMAVIYEFRKKLERLSLADLSSLVQCLKERPGAYQSEVHFNCSTLRVSSGLTHKH
jgi:hypothetical protein